MKLLACLALALFISGCQDEDANFICLETQAADAQPKAELGLVELIVRADESVAFGPVYGRQIAFPERLSIGNAEPASPKPSFVPFERDDRSTTREYYSLLIEAGLLRARDRAPSGKVFFMRSSPDLTPKTTEAELLCEKLQTPIRFSYSGLGHSFADLALIEFDDQTDAEFGAYLQHSKHVDLMAKAQKALNRSRARAIGYDVAFTALAPSAMRALANEISASPIPVVVGVTTERQVADFEGRQRSQKEILASLGLRGAFLGLTANAFALKTTAEPTATQAQNGWLSPETVVSSILTWYKTDQVLPIALQMAFAGGAIKNPDRLPVAIDKLDDEQADPLTFSLEDVASGNVVAESFDSKFVFFGSHHREIDAHQNLRHQHVNGISDVMIDLAAILKLQSDGPTDRGLNVEIAP